LVRRARPPHDFPGKSWCTPAWRTCAPGASARPRWFLQIAAPRLRTLGLEIPEDRTAEGADGDGSPEHRLYALLVDERGAGAHSRYNALLARIASFARAAGHARTR
jgi:hypothetical protein